MEIRKGGAAVAIFTGFLAGCATGPSGPPEPTLPAPVCSNATECDLKWAAARAFVLSHAGYKFQTYSNDFMETYNPVGGAVELGAQVNRVPQPNGTTTIEAKFWCDNPFGCAPPAHQTLNDFIRTVNAIHAP